MKIKYNSFSNPKIRGHYSHIVELDNGMCFLSGQKAWDAEGVLIQSDIDGQTKLVFENIKSILNESKLDFGNIVSIQCHLANENDYERFNAIYSEILKDYRPARTFLAGYKLREGALVELNVTAYRK